MPADSAEMRVLMAHADMVHETVDADDHLTDPELSPAVLARQLNVSVRTLHRAFKREYGQTPAEYARSNRR